MTKNNEYIIWFKDLSSRDVAIAGGKNVMPLYLLIEPFPTVMKKVLIILK
jgi:hypothetical protein